MSPELITEIFEIVLFPLLAILTKYLITFLQAKSLELQQKVNNETSAKYIQLITETVEKCVIATNQTYVDSLKSQGKFDEEAQLEAFNRTYNSLIALLNEETKNYIINLYGDLEMYLTQTIEATVNGQH